MPEVLNRLQVALADRYRLDRELGQGGMATVYLAEDLKHGRKVAIKVLHPELSAVIGSERFLAEIKVTANLQHPHILGLIDSGEADGLLYYVMPYVAGESLRARLARERQLPVEEALRLSREVASALDYAHRQGVVHRDIKPENILLQDGAALVADFGIALAVHQAGGSRMTQTGMSLGTPAYMSPEQAMGEREIGAAERRVRAGRHDVRDAGRRAAVHRTELAGDRRQGAHRTAAAAPAQAADRAAGRRGGDPHRAAEAAGRPLGLRPRVQRRADRGAGSRSGPVPTVPMAAARPPAGIAPRATRCGPAGPWPRVAAADRRLGADPRRGPSCRRPGSPSWSRGWAGAGRARQQRHLAFSPDGQTVVYAVGGTDGTLQLVRARARCGGGDADPERGRHGQPAGVARRAVDRGDAGRHSDRCCASRSTAARQELVGSSLISSDAAFAPDGTLWYSSDADLGTVVGDSLVPRLHKGGYHLLPDPGRRTHRAHRADAGRECRRPARAGGSPDRGRDADPGHAGHRGAGDPGAARVRDGCRHPAGRAVRSGPAAGRRGRR